jgi:putative PIN family toxin of toxin-antitoxin system
MAEDRLVEIFISLDILKEINRVLEYDKVLGILRHSGTEPGSVTAKIVSLASLVDVKTRVNVVEDPADNRILACAREAGAQFIVSGDHHLLQLGKYKNIKILAASSFLAMQKSSRN